MDYVHHNTFYFFNSKTAHFVCIFLILFVFDQKKSTFSIPVYRKYIKIRNGKVDFIISFLTF